MENPFLLKNCFHWNTFIKTVQAYYWVNSVVRTSSEEVRSNSEIPQILLIEFEGVEKVKIYTITMTKTFIKSSKEGEFIYYDFWLECLPLCQWVHPDGFIQSMYNMYIRIYVQPLAK